MVIMVALNGKLLYKNLKKKRTCKRENILHKNFTCRKIYLYSYRICTRKLSIRYFSTRKQHTRKQIL